MNLKEIIKKGLREGAKRFNFTMKRNETLCARDNMLISAQLEAVYEELSNLSASAMKKPICGFCNKEIPDGRLYSHDPETKKNECPDCVMKANEDIEGL